MCRNAIDKTCELPPRLMYWIFTAFVRPIIKSNKTAELLARQGVDLFFKANIYKKQYRDAGVTILVL